MIAAIIIAMPMVPVTSTTTAWIHSHQKTSINVFKMLVQLGCQRRYAASFRDTMLPCVIMFLLGCAL
jgi:hypothetical protein